MCGIYRGNANSFVQAPGRALNKLNCLYLELLYLAS